MTIDKTSLKHSADGGGQRISALTFHTIVSNSSSSHSFPNTPPSTKMLLSATGGSHSLGAASVVDGPTANDDNGSQDGTTTTMASYFAAILIPVFVQVIICSCMISLYVCLSRRREANKSALQNELIRQQQHNFIKTTHRHHQGVGGSVNSDSAGGGSTLTPKSYGTSNTKASILKCTDGGMTTMTLHKIVEEGSNPHYPQLDGGAGGASNSGGRFFDRNRKVCFEITNEPSTPTYSDLY